MNLVNANTGEILSEYCAPMDLMELLTSNIDTDLN